MIAAILFYILGLVVIFGITAAIVYFDRKDENKHLGCGHSQKHLDTVISNAGNGCAECKKRLEEFDEWQKQHKLLNPLNRVG